MRKLTALFIAAICGLVIPCAASQAREYSEAEQANLAATQGFLAAFESGDIDSVFAMLSDDVVWYVNGDGRFVPSHGTWTGKAEVEQWVADVVSEWEFLDFGSDQFFVDGDTVVALTHETDRAIATGKEITQSEVMIFTFTDGKISMMRAYDDSASEHWALSPDEG